MNRKIFQIASAYMSVIVGGGFASGQEVLQFFTNFGWMGVAGTVISGVLFAFLGMQIARIGTQLKVDSHKEVLQAIFGKQLSLLVDLALIFFLFGVGVAMLAGSGSLFQEHLGLPSVVGAVAMTVVIAATLCLNLHRIVDLISAVAPFLIVMVVIVVSYALFNNSGADTAALEAVAVQGEKAAGHWALSGLLYASFNIAVGFPLLAVLAGSDTNLRNTTWGGIYGGLGLGALIFLLNIGLFFNIDQIQNAQMPTVLLAKGVGSWIGVLMMISVFCMIYSTGVGMFFAFTARFAMPNTKKFRLIGLASCLVGLLLSFAGFTKLVGTVYPLLGYLGLALIAAVLVYWLRNRGKPSVAA